MLASAFPRHEQVDCLVPVPLHWWKQWRRGFNQSELLAKVLSQRLGLPVADLLKRHVATKAQAGLSAAGRRSNIEGAFRIKEKIKKDKAKKPAAGLHVMLIDDVMTTGATAAAAARVLRRDAGARRVTVFTLARADLRSHWSLVQQNEFQPVRTSFFDDEQEQD